MTPNQNPIFVLYPESQRYTNYKARMLRRQRLMQQFKRYRIALSVMAAGLLACAVVFLALIGQFFGEAVCQPITYGEQPECSLTAWLSQVQYQYASMEDGAVWSDEMPAQPGQYRMRGVSKNGFGAKRYSKEMTVTIQPRKLQATIADSRFYYGDFSDTLVDDNLTLRGLRPGDTLVKAEYAVSGTLLEGFRVSVEKLQIVNENGTDVSAAYTVSCEGGTFTMQPRPITVALENWEKEYDGLPWEEKQAFITAGSLVPE
jgi:hypothetical protein